MDECALLTEHNTQSSTARSVRGPSSRKCGNRRGSGSGHTKMHHCSLCFCLFCCCWWLTWRTYHSLQDTMCCFTFISCKLKFYEMSHTCGVSVVMFLCNEELSFFIHVRIFLHELNSESQKIRIQTREIQIRVNMCDASPAVHLNNNTSSGLQKLSILAFV